MTTKLSTDFWIQRVFTSDEVKARYGLSDHASWQLVLYAKQQGQIGAVRNGLYYVVPPGQDPTRYRPDPYLVAAKSAPEGVLAFHAALDLHGVAHSAFQEVAVAVTSWRRPFQVGDFNVRFVVSPMGFGVETLTREGVPIKVTDRERTLTDGCDRPQHSGGLEEFLRSVESFPSVDHQRILEYVRRYPRRSVAAKVGWLLDRFESRWGFPDEIREALQSLRPKGSVVLEPASGVRLSGDWGVLVPRTLESRIGGG